MQYIPQKNIKSATAAFADSLLIVCYELSYPHFMERRGSLYFSSEHTACYPVNLGYLTVYQLSTSWPSSVTSTMISH